jgi:hypothetical protein
VAPVRFLPKWDNTLLDRTRLLPEEYRDAVLRSNADVEQTFLVDGLVAGTWRFKDERLTTSPFAPLPREARRELQERPRARPPGFAASGAWNSAHTSLPPAAFIPPSIGSRRYGESVQIFTQSPHLAADNHDPANFERFKERRAEAGSAASFATRST